MGAGASIEETQKAEFIAELKQIMDNENNTTAEALLKVKQAGEVILRGDNNHDADDNNKSVTEGGNIPIASSETAELFHGENEDEPYPLVEEEAGLDNSASIQRLAASYVLGRTAEFRVGLKHKDILKAKDR